MVHVLELQIRGLSFCYIKFDWILMISVLCMVYIMQVEWHLKFGYTCDRFEEYPFAKFSFGAANWSLPCLDFESCYI
jgi:hypothetical protein